MGMSGILSYLSVLVSSLQEWKRQRAHSEADENLRSGDVGHSIRRRLCECGQGKQKVAGLRSAISDTNRP